MSKFSMEAKVGVFVLAAIAIFAYVWTHVLDFTSTRGFILTARFKTVEGLAKGAQVQIAGIKVGTVEEIRFDPDSGKAVVSMNINDAYRNFIPEDSRLFLKTKGLLGDKYVEIEPGKPNARKLKPGEELNLVFEPADTQQLIENMNVVAQDLRTVTREVRKEVIDKRGTEKLDSVLTNSDAVFKDLRSLLSRNRQKIDRTIDNTDSAAKDLREVVSRNKNKVNRTLDDMEKFSGTMDKTSDKFSKVASEFDSLARDIRAGKGTLGKLVSEDVLYRDAQNLVREMRQISSSIQRGPGAVGRLINDPELYYEARRAIRNMNKAAEDVSEATPVSTLATIFGAIFK